MKKVNLMTVLFGAVAILSGFSSCKKCVTCTTTYNSVTTEEKVCKAKDASKDEFDEQIRYIEDSNTICK